jgi:hypothetical protein
MALEPVAPPARPNTKWTCPMHPQIVRDEPGSCPICGMALEPMTVSGEEGPDHCQRGDDVQLGISHSERAAAPTCEAVIASKGEER